VTASTTPANEKNAVPKGKRRQYLRMVDDAVHTAGPDRHKPADHHRPEKTAHSTGSAALHRE
jgi:hypothetical protein